MARAVRPKPTLPRDETETAEAIATIWRTLLVVGRTMVHVVLNTPS